MIKSVAKFPYCSFCNQRSVAYLCSKPHWYSHHLGVRNISQPEFATASMHDALMQKLHPSTHESTDAFSLTSQIFLYSAKPMRIFPAEYNAAISTPQPFFRGMPSENYCSTRQGKVLWTLSLHVYFKCRCYFLVLRSVLNYATLLTWLCFFSDSICHGASESTRLKYTSLTEHTYI